MYRNYRLRHELTPPNELIVDPLYVATRIVVRMMNGVEHILFTERDGETFFHVKEALQPYVVERPALHRLSLSLRREDGSLDMDVEDGRVIPIPLNNGDVNLELIVRDLTMNAAQQALIEEWTRHTDRLTIMMRMDHTNRNYVRVLYTDVNTPDKMEAFLFYLENNPLEILKMMYMDINQIIPIMRAILDNNIPIEELTFRGDDTGDDISPDEMRAVFDMIRQINTLHVLNISNDGNLTYRMNDLADLLEQTSLHRVFIQRCNIILDGDFTDSRLSNVLIRHPTLYVVSLRGRTDENTTDFMESFQHIVPERHRYILPNGIDLHWTNPTNMPPVDEDDD